jgi:hypothetical protein
MITTITRVIVTQGMDVDWPTPPKLADYSAKNRERGKLQTSYEKLKTFADCLTRQTKCGIKIKIVYFSIRARGVVLLTRHRLSKQNRKT